MTHNGAYRPADKRWRVIFDCRLSGDILQVVPSGHVSFMWSYPNLTFSLLTGNFTGNFAKSSLKETFAMQETLLPQRFLARFPTEIIREIIFNNRDFGALNRENPIEEL
jgi:hypothetical protein